MYQEIIFEVADPVATVTLNRPKALNAWTTRMGAEVKHAMAAAENDPHVVAIVLTGAGRGFCSGADLNDLRAISQGEARADAPAELAAEPGDPSMGDSFRGTYTYPLSIRKPVIAAVNGPTAGMAIPIILACDLRFASEQASFTTAFSPRVVGTAHALDLLFSARKVDAVEAERMGLVNRVLPEGELLPFVRAYVEDMAAHCSPASLASMKRQVWRDWTRELGPVER